MSAARDSSSREKSIEAVVNLLDSVRNDVHWEDSKVRMRKYIQGGCDKDIKETYFRNEERKQVWEKVLKALD